VLLLLRTIDVSHCGSTWDRRQHVATNSTVPAALLNLALWVRIPVPPVSPPLGECGSTRLPAMLLPAKHLMHIKEETTMSVIANDSTLPQTTKSRHWIWWTLSTMGVLLLVGAISFALMLRRMADENTPPPNLDVARARLSVQGLFEGTYTPALEPITIDKLHSWTLHLETADGTPVEDATITVHGDMPGHGHGLPTKPIVSRLDNGNYLVEGMKFQMPGWWFVEFAVSAGGQQDTLRFDFVLK
jgi:hypothetical protein